MGTSRTKERASRWTVALGSSGLLLAGGLLAVWLFRAELFRAAFDNRQKWALRLLLAVDSRAIPGITRYDCAEVGEEGVTFLALALVQASEKAERPRNAAWAFASAASAGNLETARAIADRFEIDEADALSYLDHTSADKLYIDLRKWAVDDDKELVEYIFYHWSEFKRYHFVDIELFDLLEMARSAGRKERVSLMEEARRRHSNDFSYY
jgi:hypothetical protein